MGSFHKAMQVYRRQLEKGVIQAAYRGLMEYMLALRALFQKQHPELSVPGSLYYGYMDMTYFSVVPQALKERNLKVAIVFLHEAFRFEIWLAGYNKQVQAQYWQLFKDSGWNHYRLAPSTKGYDSILEHVLAEDPDFSDLPALTAQIEGEMLQFIRGVESFLAAH